MIDDAVVEEAIRDELGKAVGELTEGDLKKVKGLYYLPKITDEGLKEVAKLKQLEDLSLGDTKVTEAGVDELQKALPKCFINHNVKK